MHAFILTLISEDLLYSYLMFEVLIISSYSFLTPHVLMFDDFDSTYTRSTK